MQHAARGVHEHAAITHRHIVHAEPIWASSRSRPSRASHSPAILHIITLATAWHESNLALLLLRSSIGNHAICGRVFHSAHLFCRAADPSVQGSHSLPVAVGASLPPHVHSCSGPQRSIALLATCKEEKVRYYAFHTAHCCMISQHFPRNCPGVSTHL